LVLRDQAALHAAAEQLKQPGLRKFGYGYSTFRRKPQLDWTPWNPAVKTQAIDRRHRIVEARPVFACRRIARDTVAEKVLELQKSNRDLADAIINADQTLIRNLEPEDRELLLS
jgi:hypothetical protein